MFEYQNDEIKPSIKTTLKPLNLLNDFEITSYFLLGDYLPIRSSPWKEKRDGKRERNTCRERSIGKEQDKRKYKKGEFNAP